MRVNSEHTLDTAQWRASPHHNPRPVWASIDLVVLHCVSLPEGEYGGGAPSRLFQGTLDTQEHLDFADLAGVQVAPHLLISRAGAVEQFVRFDQRAWHAGESVWQGRAGCNDYSVGIELEGMVGDAYTEAQYACLAQVLPALCAAYPTLAASAVVGHSDIAPGRKADPGPGFDWQRLHRSHHERARASTHERVKETRR